MSDNIEHLGETKAGSEMRDTLGDTHKSSTDLQNQKLVEVVAKHKISLKDSQKRTHDAKKKIDALKSKLEAKKVEMEKAGVVFKKGKVISQAHSAPITYQGHIDEINSLYSELSKMKESFAFVEELMQAGPNDGICNIVNANLDDVSPCVEKYGMINESLDKKLSVLEINEANYASKGADVKDAVSVLKVMTSEVRAIYDRIGGALAREVAARRNYNDSVNDLRESQAKILHWCRQQRIKMEALKDPEHIQEFINSFQGNIQVMETNFMVLMELAEPLLPNTEVHQLMMDVTEMWLGLQVYAFERLNSTVVMQHVDSNMEEDTRVWMDNSEKIKDVLEHAKGLLEMPTDDESKSVTEPVLVTCQGLLGDFHEHGMIVEHLSNFSTRYNCLTEYYNAIHRTIFSKLTISTQIYNSHYAFERKQEYMDRLAELSDWVQCKSQSAAWKQLLGRVNKMKDLIEENEALQGNSQER